MLDELLKQGIRSIEDARFVRDHFIPVALEQSRWNIVVYEAHRATELLLRGMTCQTGCKPPEDHDIRKQASFLLDRLRLPGMMSAKIPFVIGAYTDSESRHGYVILLGASPHSLDLYRVSVGLFTSLTPGTKLQMPTSGQINLKLDLTPPNLSIYFNSACVLTITDSSYAGPPREIDRSFVRKPEKEKIKSLKQWGDRLSKNRDAAYYEEKLYVKGDALRAIEYMKQSFDIAGSFFSFE